MAEESKSEEGAVKDPNSGVQRATKAPPFTIQRSSRKQRYLKLLVYGNYGAGKTTLAGSCCEVPSMNDVILLDAESGDLSLEEYDIARVELGSYTELAKVYEFLRQHCKARDAGDDEKLKDLEERITGVRPDEPQKFYTVMVDSLTEVEAYCMAQLLGVSDSTKLDEETASAEWAEYKKNNNMITRMIRNFRDLPMHVIMVASEQYQQDETKKFRYSPNLTGKLSKQAQGFFDMVGYLVVGNADEHGDVPRRLYVQPSGNGRFDAKHRYAKFKGSYFDNPSIDKILKQTGLLQSDKG